MSQTGWINFYNLFAKARNPEHAKRLEDEWEDEECSRELDDLRIGIVAEGDMLRIEINDTELYDDPDEELKQLSEWLKERGVTLHGHVNLEFESDDYREDFIDGELVTADCSWLKTYDANFVNLLRELGSRLDKCYDRRCHLCDSSVLSPVWDFKNYEGINAVYSCPICGCKFRTPVFLEDGEPIIDEGGFPILSDRQLIHIYNRMPDADTVVENTSEEIEAMFDGDVHEFYNMASKGNYNTDDTWMKLNAHGHLIAFTDIADSDIDVEEVRNWARDHVDEIKDILENK